MNKIIDDILAQSSTVAIIGHINPDGDCFGSLSAVNDYILTKFNCKVHCFAECETIAEEFKPFAKDIVFNPAPLSRYDACICVDTGDLGRLGRYLEVFNDDRTVFAEVQQQKQHPWLWYSPWPPSQKVLVRKRKIQKCRTTWGTVRPESRKAPRNCLAKQPYTNVHFGCSTPWREQAPPQNAETPVLFESWVSGGFG